jgi:CubicO group peptidase (beta-lactamase class C family)
MALLSTLLVAVQIGIAQEPFDAFSRIIEKARAESEAPGISVAIVQGDRLVWARGFGAADLENNIPARADTVFRIASISKSIAAMAVMQLVERGKVSLEDTIWKYMPTYPKHGDHTITVRHLLTHTSGIRHYHYELGEKENTKQFYSVADSSKIYSVHLEPLLFTPGTRFSYSTYGYNLLAGVVEKASGLSYEAFLQENIFAPAGMKDTRLEHPEEIVPRRGRQYRRHRGSIINAPYVDLSFKWAGGGVISTVEDLARFHIALSTGELLKPETLDVAYTPYSLADGTASHYGIGWRIDRDEQDRTWIFHSGGATGGSSHLLRNREAKMAVAIICNIESAGNLGALARKLAAVLIGDQSAQDLDWPDS